MGPQASKSLQLSIVITVTDCLLGICCRMRFFYVEKAGGGRSSAEEANSCYNTCTLESTGPWTLYSKYYWPGQSKEICESLTGLSPSYLLSVFTNSMNLLKKKSNLASVKSTREKSQRNNHKLQKASGVLHPIPDSPKMWCQVDIDLIGPKPETPRGNKHVVPLTDYFIKWTEAAPLADKTALSIAKFIYSVSASEN